MNGSKTRTKSIPHGTFREFTHKELSPNPLNPRRLFDQVELDVLEDSIRKNGILVPLTVYEERNGKFYILDGDVPKKSVRRPPIRRQ
jgi:hypothetical protein